MHRVWAHIAEGLERGRGQIGAGNLAQGPSSCGRVEVELSDARHVLPQSVAVDVAADPSLPEQRGPPLQYQEQQVHNWWLSRVSCGETDRATCTSTSVGIHTHFMVRGKMYQVTGIIITLCTCIHIHIYTYMYT